MFCEKVGIIKKGPHRGAIVHGVEYETAGLLGASCGYANIEALAYANLLCDYYGLDTISTGAVIAFAMECYENGILKKDDIGGLDLNFGNYEAVHELIKMIAFREGIGNILAEGVERASRIFGKGAEKYAIHVKKLETPAWGVRGAPGMGLQYATTDRGGCHQRGWPIAYEVLGVTPPNGTLVERLSTNRKAAYVKWEQDYTSACGTLIICDLTRYDIDPKYFCCALSLVTGWNIDLEEFLKVGERVWNIIRLFNIREGITRKDDTIPERFIKDPLPSGPAKGHRVTSDDLNKMLEDYYRLRGWTDEGKPTKTKLLELNLEDIQFKDNFDS
jgi:aldehyde:ferredoxin oxidoreductase